MASRRLSLATAATILVACGGPRETGFPMIDTLETGRVLIRNGPRGAWDSESAWIATRQVSVGATEDSGPAAFGNVTDFEIDVLDRLYVLDQFAQRIYVFELDGTYVRSIGGPGSGPGEFKGVNGMAFDPSERLWVMNQGNVRYSVFDTSGTLLQEPHRPALANSGDWSGFFGPDGALYDVIMDWPTSVRYDTVTNRFVDSLRFPRLPPDTPFGWGHRRRTHRGWWLGVASDYTLYQATPRGDTTRIVEGPPNRLPIPDATTSRIPGIETPDNPRVVSDAPIPNTDPVFERLIVDDLDHLWVMLPRRDDAKRTTFDVFDVSGEFLGAVTVPAAVESFPRPVIRHDHMIYLVKGDFDVPVVEVMTILKP